MHDVDVEALRSIVIRQADAAGPEGWMEIPIDRLARPSGKLRVPRGAFERWAIRPTGAEHLAAPWEIVSPQGVKQASDDPYHTDWMLGAGLDPTDMRHSAPDKVLAEALTSAAYSARAAIERRLLGFKCSVLVSGPSVTGRVWHPSKPSKEIPWGEEPPIAILPAARSDWLDLAGRVLARGGAVIVERGGEMAHMVTELRGDGKGPLIRVEDARRLYPEGLLVGVEPSEGRVEVKDDLRPPPPGRPLPSRRVVTPGAVELKLDPEAKPFDLVRCGSDNPADNAAFMCVDSIRRVEGVNHRAYGVPHANEQGSDILGLVVRVFARDPALGRWNYYAGWRKWTSQEILDATKQALYLHEPRPDPEAYFKRVRDARQARRDKAADKLRALDNAELVELATRQVGEERRFLEEVMDGKWDREDRVDIRNDFDEFFEVMEAELTERGIPVPARHQENLESAPAPGWPGAP